jgi:hypothetical protein
MWSGRVSEFATPFDCYKAYEDGIPGWQFNARANADFMETQKYQYFSEPNIKGSGIGKRALLWQYAKKLDKNCFTERQTTGDCVSHGSRNARDTTRAVEILVKKEPEDWFRMGATEPTYGARGHGGQGMSPGVASKFERDTGFLARANYDGVVDLTKYNGAIGARWGSSGVPEAVKELCRKNRVGVITQVRSQEDLMDAMWNGYAAHSGQNASWSVDSNDKGIHYRTSRGWNHDMAICFYDDTREFFPFRVWGIMNSWGEWNQKPKAWPKEYGEWVPGMILTSADDFNVCVADGDCWVYGSIDGYPPQRLPDYGTVGLLRHG